MQGWCFKDYSEAQNPNTKYSYTDTRILKIDNLKVIDHYSQLKQNNLFIGRYIGSGPSINWNI